MESKFKVEVVERGTKEVVKTIGPTNERQAEKVARGLSINLNHANYRVQVVPA